MARELRPAGLACRAGRPSPTESAFLVSDADLRFTAWPAPGADWMIGALALGRATSGNAMLGEKVGGPGRALPFLRPAGAGRGVRARACFKSQGLIF
jgi:hypothetical protein